MKQDTDKNSGVSSYQSWLIDAVKKVVSVPCRFGLGKSEQFHHRCGDVASPAIQAAKWAKAHNTIKGCGYCGRPGEPGNCYEGPVSLASTSMKSSLCPICGIPYTGKGDS